MTLMMKIRITPFEVPFLFNFSLKRMDFSAWLATPLMTWFISQPSIDLLAVDENKQTTLHMAARYHHVTCSGRDLYATEASVYYCVWSILWRMCWAAQVVVLNLILAKASADPDPTTLASLLNAIDITVAICIENHEFCIENHELCIENHEFLLKIMNHHVEMPQFHTKIQGNTALHYAVGGAIWHQVYKSEDVTSSFPAILRVIVVPHFPWFIVDSAFHAIVFGLSSSGMYYRITRCFKHKCSILHVKFGLSCTVLDWAWV